MDIEIAKKWVSLRIASTDYARFVLADLFYDGLIPQDDNITLDMYLPELDKKDCVPLAYNPLKRNTKKKMNYLLSKPYTVTGNEDVTKYFTEILKILQDTVKELYKKNEAWWEFEPDSESPIKFKITLRKAETIVPHYTNVQETEYDSVGYLWNKIDDQGQVARYVDFVDLKGRHRYPISKANAPAEDLGHAIKNGQKVVFKSLPFVRLQGDGLYQDIRILGKMYSDRYDQADSLLEDNADPVGVVKNASGTDDDILIDDIKINKIVKVEGDGDFSYVSKTMDYSSIENFMKMLKSDISDLCGVVSREQELNYVTSGRALDRLYIDMDADAAEMGNILREGLKAFLLFIKTQTGKDYLSDFDIIFNTDKPTDETQIIQNISNSKDMLSEETLLEQHPWVEDVKKELARKKKEKEKEQNKPTSQEPLQEPSQEGEQVEEIKEEEIE